MAKKIFMKSLDAKIVANINEVLTVNFVIANERKKLTKLATRCKKVMDSEKSTEAEVENARLEKVKIDAKKKVLTAWSREVLKDHKDNRDDIWVSGLYSKLGVDKDLFEEYSSCRSENDWNKWNKYIKEELLYKVFDMKLDDKLVKPFASLLEHSVGLKLASVNAQLKGQLISDTSFNNFQEIFVKVIAEYCAKTNNNIMDVPTVEFYDSEIEYDQYLTKIVDYSFFEKIQVQEKEKKGRFT